MPGPVGWVKINDKQCRSKNSAHDPLQPRRDLILLGEPESNEGENVEAEVFEVGDRAQFHPKEGWELSGGSREQCQDDHAKDLLLRLGLSRWVWVKEKVLPEALRIDFGELLGDCTDVTEALHADDKSFLFTEAALHKVSDLVSEVVFDLQDILLC